MDFQHVGYLLPFALVLLTASSIAPNRLAPGTLTNIKYFQEVRLFLCILALSLFVGLRGLDVGTDTRMYAAIFTRSGFGTLRENITRTTQTTGYEIFSYLIRRQTENSTVLFLTATTITVALVLFAYWNIAPNFRWAVIGYITLGAYAYIGNGLRQGIAIALCLAAWTLRKRWLLASVAFAVAFSFHPSTVVFVVLFICLRKLNPSRRFLYIVTLSTFAISMLGGYVDLTWTAVLHERFAEHALAGQQGGLGTMLNILVHLSALWATYNTAARGNRDIQFAWVMFAFSPFFMAWGVHIVPMARLELYFSIFLPILVSNFVAVSAISIVRKCILLLGMLGYFAFHLISWNEMLPYGIQTQGVVGNLFLASGIILIARVIVTRVQAYAILAPSTIERTRIESHAVA